MTLLLSLIVLSLAMAQKDIYIPSEWAGGGFDYSFERSAESDNFILFWGPLAGLDPTQAPPDIRFDPQEILLTAEDLYAFYIDSISYLSDSTGLLSEWKMIVVLLHTWPGIEGWAFGGNYDGVTGAMWMHPHAASDGPTLAHEFTHALQNYTWMMYPGHGFINHDYVGFFWEAHAEFMAMQYYPEVALHFDMSRWMNTCQFHWSSTRHHYQAFIFLQFVKELDGLELIHRMWRESLIGEHPLQTYMRLTGRDQQQLNDLFGEYAMRNVTWDYAIGDLLRERVATIPEVFRLNPTIIAEPVESAEGLFRIPDHRAPQDYGYNHIRLFPERADSCTETVIQVRLTGHGETAPDAGWRWGLVAVNGEGLPRYSALLRDDDELVFTLQEEEEALYLVVAGAPLNHHNYAWEAGFPRIWRYPYTFRVRGAWPEGHQPGYSSVPAGVAGSPHPNGGGFVAATATVAPGAWIAPGAAVLDQAQVLDQARVEDHAVVRGQAIVRDQAVVRGYAQIAEDAQVGGEALVGDHARVWFGCDIRGQARVEGHSVLYLSGASDQARLGDNIFCWGAQLSGTVRLGGDAEYFRPCDAGTYLQVQGAYGRDCDGLDDHPANIALNLPYPPLLVDDLPWAGTPDCGQITGTLPSDMSPGQPLVFPNPFTETLHLALPDDQSGGHWRLVGPTGITVASGTLSPGRQHALSLPALSSGIYTLQVFGRDKPWSCRVVRG